MTSTDYPSESLKRLNQVQTIAGKICLYAMLTIAIFQARGYWVDYTTDTAEMFLRIAVISYFLAAAVYLVVDKVLRKDGSPIKG